MDTSITSNPPLPHPKVEWDAFPHPSKLAAPTVFPREAGKAQVFHIKLSDGK